MVFGILFCYVVSLSKRYLDVLSVLIDVCRSIICPMGPAPGLAGDWRIAPSTGMVCGGHTSVAGFSEPTRRQTSHQAGWPTQPTVSSTAWQLPHRQHDG